MRLAGQIRDGGARITLFRITSPTGSRVTVICFGGRRKRCPWRRQSRLSPESRQVQFRGLARRTLKAGARLEVTVQRGNTIGKFTSFTVRKGKAPRRRDACLIPGFSTPQPCP